MKPTKQKKPLPLVVVVYGLSQECHRPLVQSIGRTLASRGLIMMTAGDDSDVFISKRKNPEERSSKLAKFLERHLGTCDHVSLVFCKTAKEIEVLAADAHRFRIIVVGVSPNFNRDILGRRIDVEVFARLQEQCEVLTEAVMRFKDAFVHTRYYVASRFSDQEALICSIESLLLSSNPASYTEA